MDGNKSSRSLQSRISLSARSRTSRDEDIETASHASAYDVDEDVVPIHKMVQCLQVLPLFKDCPIEFYNGLAEHMEALVVEEGHYIVHKGDVGQEMFYIDKGTLAVENGDGKRLNQINQGVFFGEVGVLFSIPRTASVKALGHCVLYKLTRIGLEEVLDEFPAVADKMRKETDEKLESFLSNENYKNLEEVTFNHWTLSFSKVLEKEYR